jgi:tripartite-type tricarboxylate transporter receptor subunit TctC
VDDSHEKGKWIIAVCSTLTAGAPSAQTFPWRTVSFIVPSSPGGATDITARLLSGRSGER